MIKKKHTLIKLIVLIISIFVTSTTSTLSNSSTGYQNRLYVPHDPIFIQSNEEFHNIAQLEKWPGEGTPDKPYILEGWNFTAGTNLIEIVNTDVYFQIRNNIFNRGLNGIMLQNVTHGIIKSNQISDALIYKHDEGCHPSNYNGIKLSQSSQILVSDNIIKNNDVGILVFESFQNEIKDNEISNNLCWGVYISGSSYDNTFTKNIFQNNHQGTHLDYTVPEGKQAFSNVMDGNSFIFNFWSDLSLLDANQDDIIDTPYKLAGSGNVIDPYPLTHPDASPSPPSDSTISLPLLIVLISLSGVTGIIVLLLLKRKVLNY